MWLDPIVLVLILSVIIILPCQTLLCFKIKSVIIRLLPLISLLILAVFFFVRSFTANGWDGLGYLLLAFYAAILFGACALCWAIFGIARYVRKKRKKDNFVE